MSPGAGRAQTQLGSSKTVIRRAPAAQNLPVLLSSALQQSPDNTGSSWVKKQLLTSTEQWHWAAHGPDTAWPGRRGWARTGTGSAGWDSHRGCSELPPFCHQPFVVPAAQPSFQRGERMTKVCKALVFTMLSSGMSLLLFQGLNQVTSTNTLKINLQLATKFTF